MRDGPKRRPGTSEAAIDKEELERLRTHSADQERTLEAIAVLGRSARQGDLEARIVEPESYGAYADVLASLNHFLDLTDEFLREAVSAMQAVDQGNYARRILCEGFPGTFSRAAGLMNAAADSIQDLRAEALGQRARLLAEFDQMTEAAVARATETLQAQAQTTCTLTDRSAALADSTRSLTEEAKRVGETVRPLVATAADLGPVGEQLVRQGGASANLAENAAVEAGTAARRLDLLRDDSDEIAHALVRMRTLMTRLRGLTGEPEEVAAVAEEGPELRAELLEVAAQADRTTADINYHLDRIHLDGQAAYDAVRRTAGLIASLKQITDENLATAQQHVGLSGRLRRLIGHVVRSINDSARYIGTIDHVSGQIQTIAGDQGQYVDDLRLSLDKWRSQGQAFQRSLQDQP